MNNDQMLDKSKLAVLSFTIRKSFCGFIKTN